jgi:hypothetical protein
MRECPVSERCLARDSCSLICSLRSRMASTNPADVYQIIVLMAVYLG